MFKFLKKQLLKVIQLEDMPTNMLIKKYELTDRDEIMNSSTLVVRPGQTAVLVHKGQICDVFAEGSYKLAVENIPVITKLLSLPTGFDSPIKAEVYFINTRQITGLKWGTQNPIMMRDPEYGNVRIRGYGVYAFKITDPKVFMREVAGVSELTVDSVNGQFKPMIISSFTDAIASSKISALDLAENYKEFASSVVTSAKASMEKFGVEITNITIENISVPDEVEKALDEKTKLGILEDKMGTYAQYQAATAIGDAAKNEGGGLAGAGVGLGAGVAMGNVFANAFNQSLSQNKNGQEAKKEEVEKTDVSVPVCSKCGAEIVGKHKFCPECGEKLIKTCSKCGTELNGKNKFCPECGTPVGKVCPNCKKVVGDKIKFCPDCGAKL